MMTAAATTTREEETKPSSIAAEASAAVPAPDRRARCTYSSRMRETRKTS